MRNLAINRRSAVVALLLSLLLTALSVQATTPKEIVVFGDSTSDVGNLYILFGSPAGDPSFTNGRVGDGPNWTDYLASYYKHVLGMSPSLAGGSNYATSGADTTFGAGCIGLGSTGQQVMEFLNANPSIESTGNKLFVFWAGANDILCGQPDMTVPTGNIVTQISMLYDAGARHFLVLNMLPVGLTPYGLSGGPDFSSELTERVAAFNDELLAQLGSYKCNYPAAHFYAMDVHQIYLDVLANPGLYGFLNVTDPALYVGGDPDTSLWWDFVHTTTRFHALVAEQAADLLNHHRGGLRCEAM